MLLRSFVFENSVVEFYNRSVPKQITLLGMFVFVDQCLVDPRLFYLPFRTVNPTRTVISRVAGFSGKSSEVNHGQKIIEVCERT